MVIDFIYDEITDTETGETVRVRKPNTSENIVAWGAALNELAEQTVFSDETYQPTKSEIQNAHPYFIVGKNPNYTSTQVDYDSNENVQFKAVSFKAVPGTFTIALTTTELGLPTTVTNATAEVHYKISETEGVGIYKIKNPNNTNGFPMVYGDGGSNMWTITIPTDIVLATLGRTITGTLQIGLTEHLNKDRTAPYYVGSCSADTYNQLVNGSDVIIHNSGIGGGGGVLPITTE